MYRKTIVRFSSRPHVPYIGDAVAKINSRRDIHSAECPPVCFICSTGITPPVRFSSSIGSCPGGRKMYTVNSLRCRAAGAIKTTTLPCRSKATVESRDRCSGLNSTVQYVRHPPGIESKRTRNAVNGSNNESHLPECIPILSTAPPPISVGPTGSGSLHRFNRRTRNYRRAFLSSRLRCVALRFVSRIRRCYVGRVPGFWIVLHTGTVEGCACWCYTFVLLQLGAIRLRAALLPGRYGLA